jgi:transposase
MTTRTARINSLRAHLRERGWTIPLGAKRVVPQASALLADPDNVTLGPVRWMLEELVSEIVWLEQRIARVGKELKALARGHAVCERLLSIPGIGLLTATALIGFVGDLTRFKNGRHLASFLGLTPREHSSGLRRHLGGISKQGDAYLRTLLIQGARALLIAAKRKPKPDRLQSWALAIEQSRGSNKAAVAVANKLARLVWVMGTRDVRYQGHPIEVVESLQG